ncbi:MAG TPA: indole-3-glycerol phosphate synthase TrpC [Gemmatimonadales bacterium]
MTIPENSPNRKKAPFTSLHDILTATKGRVTELRARLGDIRRQAEQAEISPPWTAAFGGEHVSVIAEVKRRSPSAGAIAPNIDPAVHAANYVAGGAAAISVLTDAAHFGGSVGDLVAVRSATAVPVLRKDFIVDPVQVYESRAIGASAILLIVRALDADRLADLASLARELGMGCLVEVHGLRELEVALRLDVESIGVNARDLDTFEVNLASSEPVLRTIPSDRVAVAESGVSTRDDVVCLAAWGADAILVGTVLARATNPVAATRALTGVHRDRAPRAASGGTS